MDSTLLQIGRRLHDRRKQMNLSQEALAELAGITAQTISTAELGKKAMRADTIVRVCRALRVTPNYLLLGEVTADDGVALAEKLRCLSAAQYRHLEDIINSYISAVTGEKAD